MITSIKNWWQPNTNWRRA